MSAARLKNIVLGLWAAVALFTFGHSASQPKVCPYQEWGRPTIWKPCDGLILGGEGLFAAVFWPLYWSWELQQ